MIVYNPQLNSLKLILSTYTFHMNKLMNPHIEVPSLQDFLPASLSRFQVQKKLKCSNYPVLLLRDSRTDEHIVMKLYPIESNEVIFEFLNQARFSSLNHPNLITSIEVNEKLTFSLQGEQFQASAVLMEAAEYGDLADGPLVSMFMQDEKLLRTYFKQLICGLEYLHSNGICHLDLKPDNLLIGSDLNLKIADFDTTFRKGDSVIWSQGTRNFRAPEIIAKRCEDPEAADIFSAGIILFTWKAGFLPFLEKNPELNPSELSRRDKSGFWAKQEQRSKGKIDFSKDFKDLFTVMVKTDVFERATLEEVKSSKWVSGETYSQEELYSILSQPLEKVSLY